MRTGADGRSLVREAPAARALLATVAVFGAFAAGGAAQQVQAPPTEVYLTDLNVDARPLSASVPLNISNNPGYDNQPSFTPDSKGVLFSSNRDGKQMDIFRYDIDSKTLTQLTHTAESEFSPLVTPDGQTFSVVRVEADGTQRLWRFDLDGSNPRLILENVKPVGYHVWIDATHLGLFVLGAAGQPNTLQVADTLTGKADVLASTIGRCLQLRPSRKTLTFVSKTATPWMIKEFNPATRAITDLTQTVEGSEDFTWNNQSGDERLFMARGPKLFAGLLPAVEWREMADFSSAGIRTINRLAVRPQGQPALAFVAEPVAK
jgi:dipeptidyl aminopeptidase/acylaminoacyl peptidase